MNSMLAGVLAAVIAAPAGGPLAADAAVADRGTVKGGPALSHAFRLTHTGGGGPLAITDVKGSCGCVRSALSRRELNPGESAELAVEINTLTQPDGPNTWRFTLAYRHGDASGQVEVRLSATLVREVTVTPPMMAVSTEGTATHEIVVADGRPTPLAVTGAAASVPFLTTAVAPGTGGRTTVRVTVAADAPVGVHDAAVVLTTNDPAYRELRVPVRVTKRPRDAVRAYPETVDLRPDGGADAVAVVQFRRPDGGPVEIAKAETAGRGVVLRWSAGGGPVATLRVAVGPAAGDRGKCDVTVTFARPDGRTLTVPVGWAADGGR
jgi:hypothetical protein